MQKNKTFKSFTEYLAHFEKVAARYAAAEKMFLEATGKLVEERAKDMYGHYQRENMGKFDEWEELKDATKEDRVRQGFSENEPLLRTGKLRDSVSHHVEHKTVVVGSDSDIAPYHEFGVPSKNLPPRAVIGPAMYQSVKKIKVLAGQTMFNLITDNLKKPKVK